MKLDNPFRYVVDESDRQMTERWNQLDWLTKTTAYFSWLRWKWAVFKQRRAADRMFENLQKGIQKDLDKQMKKVRKEVADESPM